VFIFGDFARFEDGHIGCDAEDGRGHNFADFDIYGGFAFCDDFTVSSPNSMKMFVIYFT